MPPSPLREINIERGQPVVSVAMEHLALEIKRSRSMQVRAIKIIHGYGSTGKGGRIRTACRNYLDSNTGKGKKQIKRVIAGEKFSIFEEDTRQLLNLCPELRRDRDLDRHNNGVTFIIL